MNFQRLVSKFVFTGSRSAGRFKTISTCGRGNRSHVDGFLQPFSDCLESDCRWISCKADRSRW